MWRDKMNFQRLAGSLGVAVIRYTDATDSVLFKSSSVMPSDDFQNLNSYQNSTNLGYNAVPIWKEHNAGVAPVLFCLNVSNFETGGNAPEDNGVIFDEERTTD
jgi:hypothetical protein